MFYNRLSVFVDNCVINKSRIRQQQNYFSVELYQRYTNFTLLKFLALNNMLACYVSFLDLSLKKIYSRPQTTKMYKYTKEEFGYISRCIVGYNCVLKARHESYITERVILPTFLLYYVNNGMCAVDRSRFNVTIDLTKLSGRVDLTSQACNLFAADCGTIFLPTVYYK